MIGTLGAALPLAVVLAVDPDGWNPFGPARWAAVSVIGALFVVAIARRPVVRLPRWATAGWLVFLALATAATATALDGPAAWLGTAERHFGLLTWGLVAVCFVAGCQLDRRAIARVVRGMVVAAVALGVWGLVEMWWRRPVEYVSSSARLGGPFGSAAYTGAAACLLVPVAAAAACDSESSPRWRIMAMVGAVSSTVVAVGTGSRAAWVGIAGALTIAVGATGRRTAVRVVVVGVGLVGVGLLVVSPRLSDIVERSSGASSRLDEWAVATDVIAAHPVLGVGPEGYRIAFAGGVDDSYERAYGRDVMPDRAHSGPLDVAATLGVPAAVAYVGLLGLVGLAAVRTLRRRRVATMGVAIAVVAYFGQQLILFPLAELDPLAWLLAGALVVDTSRVVRRVAVPRPARAGVDALGGVAAAVLAMAGVADVAADRLARRAVDALGTPAAVEDARRAAALRPDEVRLHLVAAAASSSLDTLAGVDAALDAVGDAAAWSPRDPIVRQRNAELLSRRATITGADEDAVHAAAAWQALVADDPHCFACQLGLGDAAAGADDAATAEQAWLAADRLTDRDPRPATRLRDLYGLQDRPVDAAAMAGRVSALTSDGS